MVSDPRVDALIRHIAELESQLRSRRLPEAGWTPTFFDPPLTHTDYDGDSFSTVATNTEISAEDWSTAVPTDAKGIIIRCDARDSGSAANNAWVGLYPSASSAVRALYVDLYGKPNDQRAGRGIAMPCDSGDIWMQCLASGTDTLDIWLWLWGYWR